MSGLAVPTTIRQLLILYGLAEVLVTNDSGPGHIAAACGRRLRRSRARIGPVGRAALGDGTTIATIRGEVIDRSAAVTFLEGYLWGPERPRAAMLRAAQATARLAVRA